MLPKNVLFWLMKPRQLIAGLLLLLVIFSSIAVTYSGHQTRNMYRELQQLEKEDDDLEHEFERLLLEHSAWAEYGRLDRLAQDELHMSVPVPSNTVVLP